MLTPGAIEIRAGTLIKYPLRLHGIPADWLTRIEEWEPGVRHPLVRRDLAAIFDFRRDAVSRLLAS